MTINNMFKHAKYPQNIYVGIYQQNEGNDPDCLSMLEYCNNDNKHPELGDISILCTINNMFKHAKYPQNIYVGIYQQNEGNDPDCLSMLEYCNNDNKHPELGDISILCTINNMFK
eukprot:327342_1